MSSWQLGIDFGTSFTVAGVARDGTVTVVDVESNGRSRMPSAVFMSPDGEILVGSAAQHQAAFAPERYEPTPKRSLGEGELFLGDQMVPVTDLVAAVLRRVYTEASRQQGETTPSTVYITHPADWAETRLNLLREAIDRAGLPEYALVPEPVAAAVRIGLTSTIPEQIVAVYDFGGGTFDAAVLRRTEEGFDVAGPPAGRDPLGGEDIDQRIIDHLGEVLEPGDPDKWASLMNPPDVAWRRNASGLRTEVQRAKETLSEVTVCQLWVPGLERDIQLTRAEIEALIVPDIEMTADVFEQALKDAGVNASELTGLYLAGGSSRIPLVANTIWRRFGVRPAVQDNPKSVVAMGAASWGTLKEQARAAVATAQRLASLPKPPNSEVGGVPGQGFIGEDAPVNFAGTFRAFLAASVGIEAWPAGSTCIAELTFDHMDIPPATMRIRDEPAVGDINELTNRVGGFRRARTPGFHELWAGAAPVFGTNGVERHFMMTTSSGTVQMFEQYAVADGRAVVLACPEWARAVAQGVTLRLESLDQSKWFESRFVVIEQQRWMPSERVRLQRNGVEHGLVIDRGPVVGGYSAQQWATLQFDKLMAEHPGSTLVSRTEAPVLNHFAGEVATVSWHSGTAPMLAKRGVAVYEGTAYMMTIALPFSEQSLFAPLARQARLHPDAMVATS